MTSFKMSFQADIDRESSKSPRDNTPEFHHPYSNLRCFSEPPNLALGQDSRWPYHLSAKIPHAEFSDPRRLCSTNSSTSKVLGLGDSNIWTRLSETFRNTSHNNHSVAPTTMLGFNSNAAQIQAGPELPEIGTEVNFLMFTT